MQHLTHVALPAQNAQQHVGSSCRFQTMWLQGGSHRSTDLLRNTEDWGNPKKTEPTPRQGELHNHIRFFSSKTKQLTKSQIKQLINC